MPTCLMQTHYVLAQHAPCQPKIVKNLVRNLVIKILRTLNKYKILLNQWILHEQNVEKKTLKLITHNGIH